MTIQVLLLLAVAGALVYFIRGWHGVRLQAGKRIGFVVFLLLNAYAVVRPDDVTWLARHLGVGRGADLVLYLTVVAVVFAVLHFYLRTRELERRITDLARAVALRDAELANRSRHAALSEAALAAMVSEGREPSAPADARPPRPVRVDAPAARPVPAEPSGR